MTMAKKRIYKKLPARLHDLVRLHPPQAIHDPAGYARTQEWIDRLTDQPKLSRDQMIYLDTLTVLLEAYEAEIESMDDLPLDPVDALRTLMQDRGMSASELGRLLGNRELGGKVLRRERSLSKANVVLLASHFHVSPALFLESRAVRKRSA